MARFICYTTIALSFLFASTCPIDVNDIYNYILLITDVHNYYRTTCIIIVHSDSYTSFNETTLTQIWFRSFSRRGILTMIVSFSDLSRETKKYQNYIVRPLYVVLLTTNETMNQFELATKHIDISFPVWFVMFLPYRENPMKSFCRDPTGTGTGTGTMSGKEKGKGKGKGKGKWKGNPFNLAFDTEMLVLCYDMPILTEWYALRDNVTNVFNLAVWKPGGEFNLRTNASLYARRSNMHGEVMRIAYVKVSPFIAMKDGVLTQFLGGVMRELSKSMNFTIKVTSTSEAYGNWNEETQIWTGVIGEVVSRMVDFGIAEFSISDTRLDVVDFTLPLILSRNKVYFQKPDASSVQWSAYFKTFKMDIWTAIICTIVSVPVLLTFIKTRGRIVPNIIVDNYINVWGIFCQQGVSEFPDETSSRLALLSIFVTALVILSAYSASLISFLTVSTVSLPFSTLEEFARHGSYKLIVFKNSADYDMIVSANDTMSSSLKRLLKKKQDLPLTVLDAFQQVCSEKVGFYVTEAIQNAMDRVPCEVVYIEADKIDSLALVLNKGSPYTGLVNYQLQRFKDNGVLNKLRKTFLVVTTSRETGYPVVTLGGVAPILAVLAGGMILGCIILALEKIYYYSWDHNRGETFEFIRMLEEMRRLEQNLPENRTEPNRRREKKRVKRVENPVL